MIRSGSTFEVRHIPLHKLRVHENQHRYPDRVLHYVDLLDRPENANADPGFIMVKRRKSGYEILDGHHRYCALILTGRKRALCMIINEPTGHE